MHKFYIAERVSDILTKYPFLENSDTILEYIRESGNTFQENLDQYGGFENFANLKYFEIMATNIALCTALLTRFGDKIDSDIIKMNYKLYNEVKQELLKWSVLNYDDN